MALLVLLVLNSDIALLICYSLVVSHPEPACGRRQDVSLLKLNKIKNNICVWGGSNLLPGASIAAENTPSFPPFHLWVGTQNQQ